MDNETCLHIAVRYGNRSFINKILENTNIDVNIQNMNGSTGNI